jgi:hypothetical protein
VQMRGVPWACSSAQREMSMAGDGRDEAESRGVRGIPAAGSPGPESHSQCASNARPMRVLAFCVNTDLAHKLILCISSVNPQ